MRLYITALFFISVMVWGLQAQEATVYVNRVNLNGVDQLASALSDPDIRINEKVQVVKRIGELSKRIPSSDVPASKLYNPLLGALRPQKSVDGHHVLRQTICENLALFAKLDGSEQLVGPLGRTLNDSDEKPDVRIAAARSLGYFTKSSSAATSELMKALERELDRGPTDDNGGVVAAIISSVGALGEKKAFVPLMKVVQSSFPTYCKKEAQRALESIRWE